MAPPSIRVPASIRAGRNWFRRTVSNGDYHLCLSTFARDDPATGAQSAQLHRPVTASRSRCPGLRGRRTVARLPMRGRTSKRTDAYQERSRTCPMYAGRVTGSGYTRGHMLGSAERLREPTSANREVLYYLEHRPAARPKRLISTAGGGEWEHGRRLGGRAVARLGRYVLSGGGNCCWANTNKVVNPVRNDPDALLHRAAQKPRRAPVKKWVVNCSQGRACDSSRPVYRAQVLREERSDETRSIRLVRHLHARLRSRSEDRTQMSS